MVLSLLLAMAAAAAVRPASASPIAALYAPADGIQSVDPGGPMHSATDAPMGADPGGPIEFWTRTATPSRMTVNPGGPMITASVPPPPSRSLTTLTPSSSSSQGTALPFNPGGPMIPASQPTSKPGAKAAGPGEPTPASAGRDTPPAPSSAGPAWIPPPPPPPGGFPPPPPPPPFPYLPFPYGGYAPSCRRSTHHNTRPNPEVEVVPASASNRLMRGLPPVTTTAASLASPVTTPKACTTTLSESVSNPCEWHGTQTIYPSTTTRYQGVDCHGCTDLYVHKNVWFCPIQRINATQSVATPSTHWSTTCLPSATISEAPRTSSKAKLVRPTRTSSVDYGPLPAGLGPREAEAAPPDYGVDDMADTCACPTTLFVRAPQTAGRTSTCYSKWTTSTKQIDCDGCPLVVMTVLQGFGPVAHFTKTTTLPLGTATAYACIGS